MTMKLLHVVITITEGDDDPEELMEAVKRHIATSVEDEFNFYGPWAEDRIGNPYVSGVEVV